MLIIAMSLASMLCYFIHDIHMSFLLQFSG